MGVKSGKKEDKGQHLQGVRLDSRGRYSDSLSAANMSRRSEKMRETREKVLGGVKHIHQKGRDAYHTQQDKFQCKIFSSSDF